MNLSALGLHQIYNACFVSSRHPLEQERAVQEMFCHLFTEVDPRRILDVGRRICQIIGPGFKQFKRMSALIENSERFWTAFKEIQKDETPDGFIRCIQSLQEKILNVMNTRGHNLETLNLQNVTQFFNQPFINGYNLRSKRQAPEESSQPTKLSRQNAQYMAAMDYARSLPVPPAHGPQPAPVVVEFTQQRKQGSLNSTMKIINIFMTNNNSKNPALAKQGTYEDLRKTLDVTLRADNYKLARMVDSLFSRRNDNVSQGVQNNLPQQPQQALPPQPKQALPQQPQQGLPRKPKRDHSGQPKQALPQQPQQALPQTQRTEKDQLTLLGELHKRAVPWRPQVFAKLLCDFLYYQNEYCRVMVGRAVALESNYKKWLLEQQAQQPQLAQNNAPPPVSFMVFLVASRRLSPEHCYCKGASCPSQADCRTMNTVFGMTENELADPINAVLDATYGTHDRNQIEGIRENGRRIKAMQRERF